MCEPRQDFYLLPTASQPQSNPNFIRTPEKISSRYSPKLARRMETDTCFKCQKKGHWMVDCPLNFPDADYRKIHCRCGHGFCEVKTATNNRSNGRKYYTCPIKRGKKCEEFVRWCDDPVRESDLHPPPYKYPECPSCGAGVCKKEKEKSGPNAGRDYFSCPVEEGFGSCGFIMWEDTLLNSTSIVPARQSIQKNLHYYWDRINTTNNNDKEEGSDLNLEDSRRMRTMDNSQCPPIIASSHSPDREDACQKAAPMERGEKDKTAALSSPANHVAFPDEEHMHRYEEEKVRLDSIRDNYEKTKASLALSHQRSESLCEDASRLKAMLHQIESQLIYCKSEALKIQNDLDNINTSMLEAERSLQVAAEEAEAARKLGEEKRGKEIAAKAAERACMCL